MSSTSTASPDPGETQQRYRDNFARHLLGVSLYLQSEIMLKLTAQQGHSNLRINFEPYISIIGSSGARLSYIAELLGISRQAANQTVNQIEAAGYLTRASDPDDGRAKRLSLTPAGIELVEAGAVEAATLQGEFASIVGAEAVAQAIDALEQLNTALGLGLDNPQGLPGGLNARLAGLLPRISDYILNRLMQLTMAKGHPDLKRSFSQVLTAIGPLGGRIQQMAQNQGVSKQAISAIATELEELGYIRRVQDPEDARQLVLHFTSLGLQLIADSVAAVDELWVEFAALIGNRPLTRLCKSMQALYRALQLEEEIFNQAGPVDIPAMARQLIRQLGEEGASTLGKLLLCPSQAWGN